MAWDQEFYDPITLPGRKPLLTLRDAAEYITELPKAEHEAEEWKTAMEFLLLAAECKRPEMFARIAMMRGLHRHLPRLTGSFGDRDSGRAALGRPPFLAPISGWLFEPRFGNLSAADVGLFFQHMIDGANVDDVGRRDFMLILAAEMSHPDIDGLLEGKLRYAHVGGSR